MKSATKYLFFCTKKKREYINITESAAAFAESSGVKEGFLLVSAMHITSGVFINDNESGILGDTDEMLETLAPFKDGYRHHRTGESNGDAHLKNILTGHQVTVSVTGGKLDLGPWQEIFYAEFDGRRNKRLLLKIIGE